MKYLQEKPEKPYICPYCGWKTLREDESTLFKYECTKCGKDYTQGELMQAYQELIDFNESQKN